MKVVISEPAAVNAIVSAIEVYKKETYGLLLGKKRGKKIKIDNAISFQTSKRDYESVDLDKHRENRINNIMGHLSDGIIGDFHSHPDWPEKLSKQDTKELREMGKDKLSLLVLVKKTRTRNKWKYDSEKRRICGSLGDKYFISLTASRFNHRTNAVERLPIECDHMKELNERMQAQIAMERQFDILKMKKKRKKKNKVG